MTYYYSVIGCAVQPANPEIDMTRQATLAEFMGLAPQRAAKPRLTSAQKKALEEAAGAKALQSTFEDRIRESGAIAFAGGVARRDCPAAKGSAARAYWQRGYDAAKRAARP